MGSKKSRGREGKRDHSRQVLKISFDKKLSMCCSSFLTGNIDKKDNDLAVRFSPITRIYSLDLIPVGKSARLRTFSPRKEKKERLSGVRTTNKQDGNNKKQTSSSTDSGVTIALYRSLQVRPSDRFWCEISSFLPQRCPHGISLFPSPNWYPLPRAEIRPCTRRRRKADRLWLTDNTPCFPSNLIILLIRSILPVSKSANRALLSSYKEEEKKGKRSGECNKPH